MELDARVSWLMRGGDPAATDEEIAAANKADAEHDDRYGCYCCCPCHNQT